MKFSECMRANGIPDFPDPTGNGLSFNQASDSDLNPNNPAFQKASKVCQQKTGGGPGREGTQPGTVELDGGHVGSGANG